MPITVLEHQLQFVLKFQKALNDAHCASPVESFLNKTLLEIIEELAQNNIRLTYEGDLTID
jgi:hypothetical protein